MSRWRRRILWGGGALLAAFLAAVLAAVLVLRSAWFHEQVRLRIISEAERVTGGKVELESFRFDWRNLRAELTGFVLRGTEPADHRPLFRADRIVVGVTVVSAVRRDIYLGLLVLDRPEISIEIGEDGRSNFPRPRLRRTPGRGFVETFLRLAIREFRLNDGVCHYDSRRIPLDLRAEDFQVTGSFDASGPRYFGHLDVERLLLRAPRSFPFSFDTSLEWILERNRIQVRQARFSTASSRISAAGSIEKLRSPEARFAIVADLSMKEFAPPVRLPIEPEGTAHLDGEVVLGGGRGFVFQGPATFEGLAVVKPPVRIRGIRGAATVFASREVARFEQVSLSAVGGSFSGDAVFHRYSELHAQGEVAGIPVQQLAPSVSIPGMPWSALLSGRVRVDAKFRPGQPAEANGAADIWLHPIGDGIPIEGAVQVSFSTAPKRVQFGPSRLALPSSRVSFSGVMGEGIRVTVSSEDPKDFLSAWELFGKSPPAALPVQLAHNGVAQFGGLVSGEWSDPRVRGHLAAGPLLYEGRSFDHVAGDVEIDSRRLRLSSFTVHQRAARLQATAEIALTGWRAGPESPIAATLTLDRGRLEELLANFHPDVALSGDVNGSAAISGTAGAPVVLGRLRASGITVQDEKLDSLEARFRYAGRALQIERAQLRAGAGNLRLRGAYAFSGQDWKNGELSFELAASRFRLGQWQAVRRFRKELDARVQGSLSGSVEMRGGSPRLTALSGEVAINDLVLEERRLGQASLTASTRRNILSVNASVGLREARIRMMAEWSLAGESAGLGQIEFTNLTLGALQDVGLFGGPEQKLYVSGAFDGEIGFAGPVLRPADWRGLAKITRVELHPEAGKPANGRELTLRNDGPLLVAIDPAKVTIQSARIVSESTDLEVEGTLSYLRRNPWNLRLTGSANLAMLTAFREDLTAEGRSTLDAVIRGSLHDPQVNGRLEFQDASFYLRGLPNGLEQVNGTIRFDRTRATIEKFTSRTGGGTLELGGFISFGGEEWVYRLQAKANQVRVRYPQDVSTLLNANLSLTGSATQSLLAGEVSVTRASFTPSSDIGSILAESARTRPPAQIANPFLRGLQFDIQINTSADVEILTSLTRDIQLEADLRLRGSPLRPVLLGRVAINRGEIQFFGNKYTIRQGDVSFFNPVRVEPVVAPDLETRIRGYTVMMNFSGPVNKLNFSYRSDPPLQSQEIIALLTVGRAPGVTSQRGDTTSPADPSFLQAGGGSFLGQALAAPVSSRLERFFGVSRIKIDPQLSGVDTTPETLVTIEQQISREINLTYVTNLTRTQQQIVRVEWNFHPDWSVFAVRDSNGVFGVDFVYRRRF